MRNANGNGFLLIWSLLTATSNLFFDSSANHLDLALPFCKPQGETPQGHPIKQMLQGLQLASLEPFRWFAGQRTTVRYDTHAVVVFHL